MKEITINYILHDRDHYVKSFLNEIIKIDEDLKQNLNINFLITSNNNDRENDKIFLQNHNISSSIFLIPSGNYMEKVRTAIENSGLYSVKLDEDIFAPYTVWNYLLSNLNVLDNDDNLLISFLLSTGIPTVDTFIEQFLEEDEESILYDFFLKTPFPNVWGVDYTSLENHTIHAKEWNPINFYEEVSKLDHYYKGVHPIRFSCDAQSYMLDLVMKKFDKILSTNNFSIFYEKKPYFCNNIFGIKTQKWLEIINDTDLIKDAFDEVPISLYRQMHDLNLVLINNAFGIHPSYNTINLFGVNYIELSNNFFNMEYFKAKSILFEKSKDYSI